MATPITWYFDYVSPYAYLQFAQLEKIPAAHTISYRPVLFAGLLKHWGQLGPAEIPPKRQFTYRQVTWLAHKRSLPLRFPPAHPFNPLALLRLTLSMNNDFQVIAAIFKEIWGRGKSPDEALETLSRDFAWDHPEELVSRECSKQQLLENTRQAADAKVFGVPTLEIDDQQFWGQDALDFALDYLQNPDLFEMPQMRRLLEIPSGAQRSR